VDENLLTIIATSLRVALVASLIVMPVGGMIGWCFARTNFPFRRSIETLIMLPMVLPPVATGLLLLYALSPNYAFGRLLVELLGAPILLTWIAATIAAAVVALPLAVRSAEQAFAAVPSRFDDLAITVGHSVWTRIWRIHLPLARRGLLAGFVLVFARALGEFGATSIVAGTIPGETETLALGIYARVTTGDNSAAMSLAAVSIGIAAAAILISGHLSRPGSRRGRSAGQSNDAATTQTWMASRH